MSKELIISIYFIIFLFLILCITISSNILFYYVFATSPSFGYQEIHDPYGDVIDVICLKNHSKDTNIKNCEHDRRDPYIDIRSVDYSSDGKFLNATIWFNSPIKEGNSVNNHEETNYGMFIDADSNPNTGWQGIDYQVENSHKDGNWKKIVLEYSSMGKKRALNETKKNAVNFYEKNNFYVKIYADLSTMGSPDKYRVMFYAQKLNDISTKSPFWKEDFTSWIDIPKPEFTLLTTPSPIVLRPEEGNSYAIQLKSNNTFLPLVSNFAVKEDISDVHLNFTINSLHKSTWSNEPDSVNVEIPRNATVGTYNIPIIATINPISTIPNIFELEKKVVLNNVSEFYDLNLPVTVMKRITPIEHLAEQLANFNKTWIEPVSGIITFTGGLITGRASHWIYKQIRKKIKNNNE